jgi:EF hand
MRIIPILLMAGAAAPTVAAPPNDSALISRMAGADANRDGNITKSELLAFRATNFARLDRSGDSILTKSDIPAFLRGRSAIDFDALIIQFDANQNGQISRDEFVNGPTAVFDRADTNRDNILTEAERKAAVARARP